MVKQNQFSPRLFNGMIEDILGSTQRFLRDDILPNEWMKGNQVPVNIKEEETAYIMEVYATGIAKEDLKVSINDKNLTISFEHQESKEDENLKWIRKEFNIQHFKRSFSLNNKIDTEKISARFDNGVLYLTLPKKEAAIAVNRSIEVQ